MPKLVGIIKKGKGSNKSKAMTQKETNIEANATCNFPIKLVI